jgi:hypothetical protein
MDKPSGARFPRGKDTERSMLLSAKGEICRGINKQLLMAICKVSYPYTLLSAAVRLVFRTFELLVSL